MRHQRHVFALLIVPLPGLAPSAANDGPAYLVKNINRETERVYGAVRETVVFDDVLFFIGADLELTAAGSRVFFGADGGSRRDVWAMPLSVLREARTPRLVAFGP